MSSVVDNSFDINEDDSTKVKIMIIGDAGVGKTSIIRKYVKNEFTENYLSTIGFDFQKKKLTIGKKVINLCIWDTAGQERYQVMGKSYYNSSEGFIIVYDITDPRSFQSITNWIEQIKESAPKEAKCVLFGNKSDLTNRAITEEEGKNKANEHKMPFYETNCVHGKNLAEGIEYLVKEILNIGKNGELRNKSIGSFSVENKKKKKGCC
jgi:small GTP-binding protein